VRRLGMSDNIPSLDQIDFYFFSIYTAFMLLLLSVMTTAIQPILGFAATFIGSKIMKLAVFYFLKF
jgi:hypothetical protein